MSIIHILSSSFSLPADFRALLHPHFILFNYVDVRGTWRSHSLNISNRKLDAYEIVLSVFWHHCRNQNHSVFWYQAILQFTEFLTSNARPTIHFSAGTTPGVRPNGKGVGLVKMHTGPGVGVGKGLWIFGVYYL